MKYSIEERTAMIDHLSRILQFATVSFCQDKEFPAEEFLALHQYIKSTYPRVTALMELEVIDEYTLLYRWRGKGEGAPIMLMAHQDVVPAEETGWEHAPFSGDVADGCIWGRGAIDMKCQLAAILESCDRLIKEGFIPQNDVYLLFTHNEEGQNETGAQETAKLIRERGIRFRFILDEGGYAFYGERYGMKWDGIHVSLCEKGYADVLVYAEDLGGHASTPPKHTALGRVCRAVAAMEAHQPAPFLNAANRALFKAIAPHTSASERRIKAFENDPNKNALIRSTVTPTMMHGSDAPNVLPSRASVNLNVRLLPGQTIEEILEGIRAAVKGIEVNVEVVKATPPTPISDSEGKDYEMIVNALNQVYPELAVVPSIMTGATDSRFFVENADNIYRVSPFACTKRLLHTMHGANERIEEDSYISGIGFFETLLRNF